MRIAATKIEAINGHKILNITGSPYKVFSPIELTDELVSKMSHIIDGIDGYLPLTKYCGTVIIAECYDNLDVITHIREFLDEEAIVMGIKLSYRETKNGTGS